MIYTAIAFFTSIPIVKDGVKDNRAMWNSGIESIKKLILFVIGSKYNEGIYTSSYWL